jgi:menaquinone-dependent protoporphyrinogen oxidase
MNASTQPAAHTPPKPIAVVFATRQGHAHRVADHVGGVLQSQGLEAHVWSVLDVPGRFDLAGYSAIIVVASVHKGLHEEEMVCFARSWASELSRMTNAFISITLTQAAAERADAPQVEREHAIADVERMTQRFIEDTGWHPQRVLPLAGALLYTKYGRFLRLTAKQVARRLGGATDTSRDHVYTDWNALNAFTEEFARGALAVTAS